MNFFKKNVHFLLFVILLSLGLSFYSYQRKQISNRVIGNLNFISETLTQNIENRFFEFQDDLIFLIKNENLLRYLDEDIESKNLSNLRIRLFFEKYSDLINSITVYNASNYAQFTLSESRRLALKKDRFIYASIFRRKQYYLDNQIVKYIEVLKSSDGTVIGNVEIILDIKRFINSFRDKIYPDEKTWLFLVNLDNILLTHQYNTIYDNEERITFSDFAFIQKTVSAKIKSNLISYFVIGKTQTNFIGVIYPVNIPEMYFSIILLIDNKEAFKFINFSFIFYFFTIVIITFIFQFFKTIMEKKIIKLMRKSKRYSKRYNDLFNKIPFPVIETTSDYKVLAINDEAKKFFKIFEPNDFYIDKINNVISKDFLSLFSDIENFTNNKTHIILKRFNEELTLERLMLKSAKNKDNFLFIYKNVSAHIYAENQLKLVQKNNFEFLANLSHEIKTPISTISNFTNILKTENLLSDKQVFLDQIIVSAKSLLDVVNNILGLSKLELNVIHPENVPFDLKSALDTLVKEFTFLSNQKKLEFTYEIEEKIPLIISDPVKIKQIIANLLSNAFKFTLSGWVKLKVYQLTDYNHKSIVRFEISDSGVGIQKEKQDMIFKPFIQVSNTFSRKFGGSGLGLTISKKLASVIDGEMYLLRSSNEGSCFVLDIPKIEFPQK